MRRTHKKQLPLKETTSDYPKVKELEKIGMILNQNSNIYDLVLQDLSTSTHATGATWMGAEQILKAAIIKQMEGFSYEALAFHLADSKTYRNFCGLQYAKSTLNGAIKTISAQTWESVNSILIASAATEKIESGRKIRIDCTVVESNIHTPFDSELLWDGVRVLTRLLNQAKGELDNFQPRFVDHTRRSKRRRLGILNAKDTKQRKKLYKDLIKMAGETVGSAESALRSLDDFHASTPEQAALGAWVKTQIAHYLPLVRQVICQAARRVLHGESVPASEKLVPIFEPHIDIIKKDRHDTYYGHKVCLTGGVSNLILDCQILSGNPADSTLTREMLELQKQLYSRLPLKVALDGGFASRENLEIAKEQGIMDVCFAKGRGLEENDMCRSPYVYKALRKFQAGIESGISWLKRSFGFNRCIWKGHESFKSYAWASIVSANLLTLARIKLSVG